MPTPVLTPQLVQQLCDLIGQLISLDQTEITQNQALNQQVTDLQNQIAAFQNPALNTAVQTAITNAVAAIPPAPPASTTPTPTPAPAAPTPAPTST